MRWCTAVNAWGDSMVAYGNARALIQQGFGEQAFGMVHYGFDPAISAFLSHQEGVGEVRHVRPENEAARRYWVSVMSNPNVPLSDYAGELLRGTGIPAERVARTHVYHLNFPQPVHRWQGPVLPEDSLSWAQAFAGRVSEGRPFLLLHPYSTQSSALEGHWPWWRQAVEWLVADVAPKFGVKILWTGAVAPIDIRSPWLVNAVGLTPSMLEVFALQRLAALTICTSNGCAHWAVIDQKPAVVSCNNHMIPDDPLPGGHIFKRWISTPPVVQVEYRDKLEVFQRRVCEALSEVGL
jgi:hypothetical protein